MKTVNPTRIPAPPACSRLWQRPLPWLLLLCLMAGGCIYDSSPGGADPPGPDGPVPVTIRLVTRFGSGAKHASTRGLTETDEGQVDNVYVFFLRVSDNKVHSVVKGKDVTNNTATQKTFTASLEVAGSAGQEFRCVVLANAGNLLDAQNLNLYKEKTYDQIRQKLVTDPAYASAPELAAGGFVMWGEADELVSATRRPQKVTVNMIRAVARVDIGVGVSPGKWDGKDATGADIPFTLKKVFIFKPNNQCAFIPKAGAYDATAKRVTKPSPAGEVCAVPFEYNVQPAGASPSTPPATSLTATIYLPEADVRLGENAQSGDLKHTERCAIVVGGSYRGHADSYYRIDFRNGPGTAIADLLRNHRYQASITSVSADGEQTPEEAYESKRVNISATVLGWNDWSQDVVFDGVDHVYVESKTILLPGNAGQTGAIGTESNVDPAEWQMSLDGVNFSTDATISNADFDVAKPAAKKGSLLIRTRNTLADGEAKSATLAIKINRLEFTISIEQRPDTPEDWVEGGEFPKDF